MNAYRIITVLAVAILFSGCAATPINIAAQQELISYNQPEDKGLVYIKRNSAFLGSAVITAHLIDDQHVGKLGNGDGYLAVEVDPGQHTFKYTGNHGLTGQYIEKQFSIEAAEKKTIAYTLNASNELPTTNAFQQQDIAGLPLGDFRKITDPMLAQQKAEEAEQKEQQRLDELKQQNIAHLNELINAGKKDEFMTFLDQDPSLAEHIQNPTYKLLLTGPKELRIGKIAKMLDQGFGDKVIIAKINGVEAPYRDFSIDELMELKKLKFSDDIVAAMMDVTTELNKEQARIAREEAMMEEQRKMAQEMKAQAQLSQAGRQNSNGNAVVDAAGQEVSKAVGRELGKALLDHLF